MQIWEIQHQRDLDTRINFSGSLQHADEYLRVVEEKPLDSIEELFVYLENPKKEQPFWIDRFAKMTNLKRLSFKSRPNQEIFEAICEIPNLNRLHIWWSNISDLTPIQNLQSLTHLQIGSSPKVRSITPFASLKSLCALSIHGRWPALTTVSPLSEMCSLRNLDISGAENTWLVVDSLEPLSQLQNLEILTLSLIKTKDRRLPPLSQMSKLTHAYLGTLNAWPQSEYERLHKNFPNCESLALAATDKSHRRMHSSIQIYV